jgi:hypothetical protein
MIKHFKDSKEILLYLKSNPIWISAFANGEGCFTASLMFYLRGMWGLQPQCEFNITQKVEDLPLLEAINAYIAENPQGVPMPPEGLVLDCPKARALITKVVSMLSLTRWL